jgi:hypothetical protein
VKDVLDKKSILNSKSLHQLYSSQNIRTWVISTCPAVAPHQGTKTLIFGYRANMVRNYFLSCFYADALFSLPVGDNEDDKSLVCT